MIRLSLILSLCLSAAAAQAETELPDPLRAVLSERVTDCEGFESGTLELEADAIQRVDLTGNGEDDWVLDEFHLRCSSAASMYCGTGGCGLNLLVDGVVTSRLSKGWDVTDLGPLRTVLIQIHGSACGGTNVNACVEAMVWDATEGRFFSPIDQN